MSKQVEEPNLGLVGKPKDAEITYTEEPRSFIHLSLSHEDLEGEELTTPYLSRAELVSDDGGSHSTAEEEDRGTAAELAKVTSLNVGPPPDGGLKAWLQVLGGFFAFMNAFGVTNSFAVFQAYYRDTLIPNSSDSAISWIGSIQGCFIISGSVVIGRLTDAGYALYLVAFGAVVGSFSFMMMSLCTRYYQLLLCNGLLMGIGLSCMFMSSLTIVNTYFSKNKGLASGIVAAGSSLGAIIYPIMINRLITEVGYPWTSRIMGFTVLATSSVSVLTLRPRLPPRRSGPFIAMNLITDLPYQLLSIGIFLGFFGAYIPIFYIQAYANREGVNANLQLYVTSILASGSLFGRLIPNMIADRIGALNTFGPVLLLNGLVAFCWIAVDGTAGVIVFAFFYGFMSGGVVSLPAVSLVSITPKLSALGTRMGITLLFGGLGILAGSPIAGKLLTVHNGNYIGIQLFSAILITSAGVFVMVARFLVAKRKGTQIV